MLVSSVRLRAWYSNPRRSATFSGASNRLAGLVSVILRPSCVSKRGVVLYAFRFFSFKPVLHIIDPGDDLKIAPSGRKRAWLSIKLILLIRVDRARWHQFHTDDPPQNCPRYADCDTVVACGNSRRCAAAKNDTLASRTLSGGSKYVANRLRNPLKCSPRDNHSAGWNTTQRPRLC